MIMLRKDHLEVTEELIPHASLKIGGGTLDIS